MTSQDLVPQGLEQGARQENVANFREAGIPLSSSSVANPPPATAGPAGLPAPMSVGTPLPPDFDVFANRAPRPDMAPIPEQTMFGLVADSPNPVLRDIFAEIPGYQEG